MVNKMEEEVFEESLDLSDIDFISEDDEDTQEQF